MKKIITKNWAIILILLFAFVLRFWRLGSFPALNADEAALGYNAYSLIQTGKDEHGNPWPIHFQSFNDYKPGLYVYLAIPFIKILGLTPLAVRIPGAAFGVATVFLVYLLVKKLFAGRKYISEIAALLLAISPWHIHFSRGAWEVNVATFFITLGVLLFIQKKFLFSILAFVFSLYTYHAARLIAPLLGLGLIVIYWRQLKGNFKNLVVACAVGVVLLLPLVKDLTTGAVASRAAGVGLFADAGPLSRINEQRGEHGNLASLPAIFLHNKAVNYALAFASNWAEHFSGDFLFISGDEIQRSKVPEMGQMYLFEIVTLAVGAWFLVKNSGKHTTLLILWLVVAPIAAALTFQSPHALRAHNMVIPLVIISAAGMSEILVLVKKNLKNKNILTACYILLAAVVVWEFARYEHEYWVHMARQYPFSSQYGVKELVDYIQTQEDKHSEIVITDRYDQPYILFLFYLKYPPAKFQNDHKLTPRDQYGFSTVRQFDKYRFRAFEFVEESNNSPGALIIGTAEEIPDWVNVVKDIYGSNGYMYFQAVAN